MSLSALETVTLEIVLMINAYPRGALTAFEPGTLLQLLNAEGTRIAAMEVTDQQTLYSIIHGGYLTWVVLTPVPVVRIGDDHAAGA